MSSVTLPQVVEVLQQVAPLELAEEWDNVGLLVSPSDPRPVTSIFLTIDLTRGVLAEAVDRQAELIVAYHPTLFRPIRRLSGGRPLERVVIELIERRIALYSPHTAADAAPGGVNDWLADGVGEGLRRSLLRPRVEGLAGIAGQGRGIVLTEPSPLKKIVTRMKRHLGLAKIRVAMSERHREGELIRSVALCAGAGSEVILDEPADLLITGEMSHHDLLAAVASGRSVILGEHSNTERGYLRVLADQLSARLGASVVVHVSSVDADPLGVE